MLQHPDPGSGKQIIPIEIIKIPPTGRHIFLRGRIGRKRVRFLIDTGASSCVLDSTFVHHAFPRAILRNTEHLTTGLGASLPNSIFTRMRRVKAGSFSLGSIDFAVLDLSTVNSAYLESGLEPVQAIIGGDILHALDAVIDYGKKQLLLS
ncbi:MAG: aspartyl protease family protein [Chitinophagales bacterium]